MLQKIDDKVNLHAIFHSHSTWLNHHFPSPEETFARQMSNQLEDQRSCHFYFLFSFSKGMPGDP